MKEKYHQHSIKAISIKYFNSGKFVETSIKNQTKYNLVYLDHYGKKEMINELTTDFLLNINKMVSHQILQPPENGEIAQICLPFSIKMIDLISKDLTTKNTFDDITLIKATTYNNIPMLQDLSTDDECNTMLSKFDIKLSNEIVDLGDSKMTRTKVRDFYQLMGIPSNDDRYYATLCMCNVISPE